VSYLEVLPDECGETAAAFLHRALRWFRRRGITIESVITDNGPCYISKVFNEALHERRHLYTKPYRPQTNGKAERFIQTMLRECAYARPYRTSNQRTKALAKWLREYNETRPHSALGYRAPMTRIRRP
jgi:transposase InsO family protein